MLQFALADIPLIGPKAQERLARFGLRTVRDVVPHDRETLVGWLGEREGAWLHERARGIDRAPVEANRETKSVSRDETFATDLDDDGALAAKLLALADRARVISRVIDEVREKFGPDALGRGGAR